MAKIKDFNRFPNAWVLNLNRGNLKEPKLKMVMLVKRGRRYVYSNECIDERYKVSGKKVANYLDCEGDPSKKMFLTKVEAEEYLSKYQLVQDIRKKVEQLDPDALSLEEIKSLYNILSEKKNEETIEKQKKGSI